MPNTLTNDQIISATYVAMFQRAPDLSGLTDWRANAAASGKVAGSIDLAKDMAVKFGAHPAFTTLYGGMGDAAFIDAIYTNIGGKVADAQGKAAWLAKLTDAAHPITRAQLVGEFIHGVLSITVDEINALAISAAEKTDAIARQDRLTNKATVALEFTKAMGAGSNLGAGTDGMSLTSLAKDPAYVASQAIISNVTELDSTMTAPSDYLKATPTLNGIITTFGNGGGTGSGGETFTLTNGTDIITPTTHLLNDGLSSPSSRPGSGNDTFLASGATNFSDADVLDGGAGTDTLKFSATAAANTNKLTGLTSIENVIATITAADTKTYTINADNNSGIQVLTLKDAGAVSMTTNDELITVTNLNRATVLGIDGGTASSGATASEITANFKSAVAGDTQKVAISNAGKVGVLTLATAETVEITATGTGATANTIGKLTAGAVKTLNIKGDGKLTISDSDLAAAVTVDATANKGGVDFTAEAGSALNFKGGEGNDRLVIKPAELTTADTVDMGAGTNTLALTTITKLEQGTTSSTDITATELTAIKAAKNVQVIEGTAVAVTKVNFANFTQSTIKLSGDLSAGLTAYGIETGDTLALSVSNTPFNGDAITLQGAGPNQTAAITIGGAASVAISATDGGAGNAALTTDTGISTVSINSITTAASKVGITNSFALAAAATATHTVDNSAAGSFTLKGDVNFTIASGNTAGFTKAVDFNASDFTGKLTLAGSVDIDIIKAGSGGSVITGLGGADKITLGAGVDQVVYTNKNQSVNGAQDVITGFKASGADKIVLDGITKAELSTSVLANAQSAVNALVTGATLTNALDAAANAATTNNGLVWFEFGGNTYALVESTGATTTYVATDLVIQLVGTGLNLAYTDFTAAVA